MSSNDKSKSRKWISLKIAMYVHIPVIIAGTVAYFFDRPATLALGSLGSLVVIIGAYAGFNVSQKKVFQNGISSTK